MLYIYVARVWAVISRYSLYYAQREMEDLIREQPSACIKTAKKACPNRYTLYSIHQPWSFPDIDHPQELDKPTGDANLGLLPS